MGRPGLTLHRKFKLLARLVGGAAIARGSLELMWDSAYDNGNDLLGTPEEVEAVCEWTGEPGKLTPALKLAGFVEQDEDGSYRVHDLYDHAPEYVKRRMERALQRDERGQTISDIRRAAVNKRRDRGSSNAQAATNEHLVVTGSIQTATSEPSNRTNDKKNGTNGRTPLPGEKKKNTAAKNGGSRDTWLTPFAEVWKSAYGGTIHFGKAGKFLQLPVSELGAEEVARRFAAYVRQTPAQFASVAKFAETIGAWAVPPAVTADGDSGEFDPYSREMVPCTNPDCPDPPGERFHFKHEGCPGLRRAQA